MEHAAIGEHHIHEVLTAGLPVWLGEDYIDPGLIEIESFWVDSVRDKTVRIGANVDVIIHDGISGIAFVELDRWEPTKGRFLSLEVA